MAGPSSNQQEESSQAHNHARRGETPVAKENAVPHLLGEEAQRLVQRKGMSRPLSGPTVGCWSCETLLQVLQSQDEVLEFIRTVERDAEILVLVSTHI